MGKEAVDTLYIDFRLDLLKKLENCLSAKKDYCFTCNHTEPSSWTEFPVR